MARQKPKRRKKKKRKKGRNKGGGGYSGRGSGGVMQSMLGGFKRAAGAEPSKGGKSNLWGNILWILLIAAATALVVNSYTQ
jgi:hypothetical protein